MSPEALSPVLFVAHGNPMNALGRTQFGRFLAEWGRTLPRPPAILAVSAHWERNALAVTSSARPRTIHDFSGFPAELYGISYPAPGSPDLAARAIALLEAAGLPTESDPARGLDHGAWSPLRLLFPAADVPVLELSLPAGPPDERHLEVGRAIAPLRAENVLIMGSGNLVHNLALADLSDEILPVAGWAEEFDDWVEERLLAWDLDALADPDTRSPGFLRAHPSPEHYTPLLVTCGAAGARPEVTFPYEGFEHASLSLRCVRMG